MLFPSSQSIDTVPVHTWLLPHRASTFHDLCVLCIWPYVQQEVAVLLLFDGRCLTSIYSFRSWAARCSQRQGQRRSGSRPRRQLVKQQRCVFVGEARLHFFHVVALAAPSRSWIHAFQFNHGIAFYSHEIRTGPLFTKRKPSTHSEFSEFDLFTFTTACSLAPLTSLPKENSILILRFDLITFTPACSLA